MTVLSFGASERLCSPVNLLAHLNNPSNTPHVKLWIGAPVLALLAAAAILIARPAEPAYQGRPLSSWVDDYASGGPLTRVQIGSVQRLVRSPNAAYTARALEAIRAIGTNALPYLVAWARYEPPMLGARFLRWAPARIVAMVDGLHSQRSKRAEVSFHVLEELGTNAAPAIPALAQLVNETNHLFRAHRAAITMSHLGPEALPVMVSVLQTCTPMSRTSISDAMATHLIPTINSPDSIPFLLDILKTENNPLQSAASNAVWRIAPELLTNTPSQ